MNRWLDQLEKDRKQFKELPDKKSKLTFLYDYYKVPIIIALIVVFLLGSFIFRSVFTVPVKMRAVLVNSDSLVVEGDESVFEEIYGLTDRRDRGKIDVRTDLFLSEEEGREDMSSLEVLSALFTLGEVDLYVSDPAHFDSFAKQDAFADLSVLLDEETLEKAKEDLYTVTKDDGTSVPFGILLKEDSFLQKAGYYHHDVVLGIAASGEHMEEASAFLKAYLLNRK